MAREQVLFSILQGLTLVSAVANSDDLLTFTANDGRVFEQYHDQDCCEHVYIESVVGDLSDLVGTPICVAEEKISTERPEGVPVPDYSEGAETWSFYTLRTIKGSVDIRWCGASNGYYSETVGLYLTT